MFITVLLTYGVSPPSLVSDQGARLLRELSVAGAGVGHAAARRRFGLWCREALGRDGAGGPPIMAQPWLWLTTSTLWPSGSSTNAL
jgi:hypothetical protein